MKRILVCGDGVTKTGFSTVLHNIIKGLPRRKYDVHHLAINYYGDPHEYNWKCYPASLKGDLWGFNRIQEFADKKLDGIFILNDLWVVQKYLEKIKKTFAVIPPIVIYTPIDSKELDFMWFEHYDIVSKLVVYTKFGYDEIVKTVPEIIPEIIQHGVDSKSFYKLDVPKSELRKKLFSGEKEDLINSFMILNANRNQPRKRIDLTIEGFAKFSENKPKNVKLYLHMGIKDAGWDILKLAYRYGIDDRLIITSTESVVQQISETKLNAIYNSADVGINTSFGEGWGLVNHEHACTGAPQLVSDHSSLHELYEDCGILIPAKYPHRNTDSLTIGATSDTDDIAAALEKIYTDRTLFEELSRKSIDKFTSKVYSWEYIVQEKWLPLFEEVFDSEKSIPNKLFPKPKKE